MRYPSKALKGSNNIQRCINSFICVGLYTFSGKTKNIQTAHLWLILKLCEALLLSKYIFRVVISFGWINIVSSTFLWLVLSWKWKCSIVCNSLGPHGLYSPWTSPGQNTGVGSRSLLQGTFPTQGLNPGLPQCRQILYQLSHQGSPRMMERVVYPFSSGSSWPRNQTGVPALQVDSLPAELQGKPECFHVYVSLSFTFNPGFMCNMFLLWTAND